MQTKKKLPLYGQLTLSLVALALAMALAFAFLGIWSNQQYHNEVTQQLHLDLAQYIVEHQYDPLILAEGKPNKKALKAMAINTMVINPMVEVYLLDSQGKILGHALPTGSVEREQVDIEPIKQVINRESGPILGDNPRNQNGEKIFSVAPIMKDQDLAGYLYIILASHDAETMAQRLEGSHILRLTIGGVIAVLIFTLGTALWSFRRITRPIRQLAKQTKDFRQSSLMDGSSNPNEPIEADSKIYDELIELQQSFDLMQDRIQQQFEQLQETDRIRRELISNVSHDLRTPLASMQGYIETLLLKYSQLSEEKQKHYLKVAHRHSRRLTKLVAQLFELSKLDAGRVEPKLEHFSLAELLHDISQEYQLEAQKKEINLRITHNNDAALVNADIGLIERVLQNLLDNALRYTPKKGEISISLKTNSSQVEVEISDTGDGIPGAELPFVFERYYRAQQPQKDRPNKGTGLGLAIVKKILELHGSQIEVTSQPNQGTCFTFPLPLAQVA